METKPFNQSILRRIFFIGIIALLVVSTTVTMTFADTTGEEGETSSPAATEEGTTGGSTIDQDNTGTTEDLTTQGGNTETTDQEPAAEEKQATIKIGYSLESESDGDLVCLYNGEVRKNAISTINGKKYFSQADGTIATNQYISFRGRIMYVGEDGAAQTGKITYKGNTYIADDSGLIQTGLFSYDGDKYYADKTGKVTKNKIVKVGTKSYYFGKYGSAMQGKLYCTGGKRVVGLADGSLAKNRWVIVNGVRYYAGSNNYLYMNKLAKVGGYKYYFTASGTLVKNTKKTISGKVYTFNSVGKCIKISVSASAVVAYAKKFIGNRYVYGGSSLTKGTDCSGFTMSVYKKFGVSLPHSSYGQQKKGKAVSTPRAGDLVIYSGHVAMYIGNGKIIHAINASQGIRITSMYYCGRPIAYRRVI